MLFLGSCDKPKPNLNALSERTKKILELQSCEFIYRDVIYQGHLEKFLGLMTTKETRLLFSVKLRVKAGIDMAQGLEILPFAAPNSLGDPAVKILLPAASILSVDSDENSIHQYFVYEYGLFEEGKIKLLDFQDELGKARDQAKADAVKRGILLKAWNNSRTVIENLFRMAGFKTVIVELTAESPAEKQSK